MKRMINRLLMLFAITYVGAGMCGCVKTYEDERIELIRRPQIDLEPESPGWDDGGTEHID